MLPIRYHVIQVFDKIQHSIAVANEAQKTRNFIDIEKAKGIYTNICFATTHLGRHLNR